jgi:hypothetical protein
MGLQAPFGLCSFKLCSFDWRHVCPRES